MIPRPAARFAALVFLTLLLVLLAGGRSLRAQDLIYGIGGNDIGAGPNASALTLFSFQSNVPDTLTTYGTITPTVNYALESIAFQPSTGTLYGLEYNGAQGQLVTIDRTNANLQTVGNAFGLGSIAGSNGNSASISFNRQTGMLQLVTGNAASYTVNPATGALSTATTLTYGSGDVNAGKSFQISTVAFTNNTLYDIDYRNNYLTTQNLTTGVLSSTSLGLGLIASQNAGSEGFTFPQRGAIGYLSASTSTSGVVQDRFFTVNLVTGAASNIGAIGTSTTFNTVDIAVFVPEPGTYAWCLAGVGLVVGMIRRHRQAVV